VTAVLKSGKPERLEVTEEVLASLARGREDLEIWRALDPGALLAVPLLARARRLGAILFVRMAPARAYSDDDAALAEDLAERAALALDNARLFGAREEVVAVVSHDLRNPLNIISLSASL